MADPAVEVEESDPQFQLELAKHVIKHVANCPFCSSCKSVASLYCVMVSEEEEHREIKAEQIEAALAGAQNT